MKPLRVCLLLAGAFFSTPVSPSNAQLPQHQWSQRYGGANMETANDVAVDIQNHVVMVGSFEGTIDLGGGPLTSAGNTDIFVARFDGNGGHLWSQRFGSTGADVAHGVVSESAALGGGNYAHVYTMTGSFEGTVNFGGSDLTSAGGSDVFVVQLDDAGGHEWSTRAGDTGNDAGYSIAKKSTAYGVAVTGAVSDTQTGLPDVFLAAYDAGGVEQWSDSFGGPLSDVGRGVSFFGSRIAITGEFRDQASFGGAPLVSAGGSDIFIATYDATGTHLWSKQLGGTQDDAGLALLLNGANHLASTGYFRGTVNFGGSNLNSAGGEDVFVLRLDPNGAHVESRRYGGTGNDAGTDVEFDTVIGRFENSINLGLNTLVSAGGSDGFVAMFMSNGTTRRTYRLGGTGDDVVHAMAPYAYLYPSGGYDLIFVGKFMNTMNVGGGPLTSAGNHDAYAVYYAEAWLTPVGPPRPGNLAIDSYPNPFNPVTTVRYTVPSAGQVTVAIYSVSGERIATLVNTGNHSAGAHEVQWRGATDGGIEAASGVYFARVEHLGAKQSTRLVLLK